MSDESAAAQTIAARPHRGVWPWVVGFATLVIPLAGGVIAGIAQAILLHWYNKRDDLGAVNARNAANWGLSSAVLLVLGTILFFLGSFLSKVFGVIGLFVLGIVIILQLVYAVAGTVQALRGKSFDTALSYRFFKGPRTFTL